MCIDPRAPAVLRNGKVIRQQWQKRLNKTVKERAIRSGRDDVVFFSTSEDKTETRGPDLGTSLEFLGALKCPKGKIVRREHPFPEEREIVFVENRPIPLDSSNVHLVHEPQDHEECVPLKCEEERILKKEEDFPDPQERGNGGGTTCAP